MIAEVVDSAVKWRNRTLEVRELGRVDYEDGLALQRRLVHQRRAGEVGDQLLLLEHPPVITRGSSSQDEHILLSADALAERRVAVYEAGRGGDVTYHGPGQLVGYPILDLKPDRRDLHAYLRSLEEVLIRLLADFGLQADREAGFTGVWVGGEKVAALGIRVSSGWITSHGLALNVEPDLADFEMIVPCGLAGRSVTSMRRLLGPGADLTEVPDRLTRAFAEVFGYGSVAYAGGSNSK